MKISLRPALVLAIAVASSASVACSSSSGASGDGSGGNTSAATAGSGADAGAPDREPTTDDFTCIHGSDWTQVGISHYKNILGNTDAMLAIARSADGGVFPPGTIVQLVPTEASVKRGAGYSADSHDWEFFSLTAASSGTTIGAHGGDAGVLNVFNLSCLNCHIKAAPQWDLICGNNVDGGSDHGCDPLPIAGSTLAALGDPRCP
ncbi:MAG TPA: hypothetical protein VHV30_10905 [Polyangiaceae bacterium]|jgi:hypothetical protein|nr:hypothetical protein [Polyangiaceae bacterium]